MINKNVAVLITIFGIFSAFTIYAQSASNGSLSLVKDLQSGLFTITVSDSEGVASFSLEFKTGKLPYGGDFSGCAKSKKIDQIAAVNDSDLEAKIKGKVVDCQSGEAEFEISTVDNRGRAQVKKLGSEPAPEPAASTPSKTPVTPTETKSIEQTAPSAKASEITFPVPELGNCKDKESCFAYCELPENGKKCVEFAKKHGLLPEEEIRVAEQVLGVKGGPGGCNSKISCENYCNDVSHIEECLAFAEENGLMKGKELEEAKKVRAAVQRGQKMPGDCRNKNACENYCKNPEHMDECLAFAEAAGFLPPEELEQAKKFLPLMKSGQTPGGCKSKDECEAFCESDEHFEECLNFAEKNGMIPESEREHIEAFKKAGGRGPGGCKGRQCQAFCENPSNQQACFEWARDNGILKEEDVKRMEEGKQQIEKVFTDAPPEVQECINNAIPGGVEAMRSGKFFGGEAVGEKIRSCFEGFMSRMGGSFGGPGEHGPGGPEGGDFSGPGGCKGPEECMSYCKNNPEECQGFAPPSGGMPGERRGGPGGPGGPGGCKSKEECQAYCEANPKDCEGFGKPGESVHPEGRFPQPPQQGEFTPPNEFPGKPGEFNERHDEQFPPPQEFPGQQNGQQQYQQEFQKQFEQQYQQEYQQEFQKQYEQQYQQQYQQQSGGYPPASEEFHQQPPPSGSYPPPTDGSYQYQSPPPSGSQPPPSDYQQPPPPHSRSNPSPFAIILAPFIDLFIK